jgi:hypothetical protein
MDVLPGRRELKWETTKEPNFMVSKILEFRAESFQRLFTPPRRRRV